MNITGRVFGWLSEGLVLGVQIEVTFLTNFPDHCFFYTLFAALVRLASMVPCPFGLTVV